MVYIIVKWKCKHLYLLFRILFALVMLPARSPRDLLPSEPLCTTFLSASGHI